LNFCFTNKLLLIVEGDEKSVFAGSRLAKN